MESKLAGSWSIYSECQPRVSMGTRSPPGLFLEGWSGGGGGRNSSCLTTRLGAANGRQGGASWSLQVLRTTGLQDLGTGR